MAKVLKHVFVQCFSFGDIHQLFLVRVGRTTQISDLSTAQTMNDEIIEYLVLTVVCSSQSFFFYSCWLSLFVFLVSSLNPPRKGCVFLHPFTR